MEEWRNIFGYEGSYRISNKGRVYSVKRKKILKPFLTMHGYFKIFLSKDAKRKLHAIHRLVAAEFVGRSTLQVNHINRDKTDNSPENLEYVSNRENSTYCEMRMNRNLPTGVSKVGEFYKARIKVKGKDKHLGVYEDPSSAHQAYCDALKSMKLENKYARSN